MLILGIDPGIAITGYGFLDFSKKNPVISSGSINTSKNKSQEARLAELFDDMHTIIKTYKPDVAAIEKLFYFKNLKTIIPVAQARGVIMLALAQNSIPVIEYTPLEVKLTITGYGRAKKDEVKKMAEIALGTTLPKLDDVADAIAIALCHQRHLM